MADWREKSLGFWQNLSKRQKIAIIGSIIAVIVAVLGWSYWMGSRQDMVPLFTNMELQDAGEVQNKLKEMKVPYDIGGNGTAILVSSKDVHRIRLELASQGLPRGSKGFELFDQSKFGVTEFQNKVNYLQALQGELTRTIEQIAEVEKARVHIVLPEDSLYKKNEKPATASVMLKLKPMKELSPEQVKGIVNLVSHSISSLKPENITVVDNFSRILNEPDENQKFTVNKATITQIEMTKKVQDDLQKNLQSLLEQVLGAGKAAARVTVELNFDQRTMDKQTFEPVVDDKGIVRSSQDISESFKGTSPNPGGIPGTTTNIPGYVTTNTTQSSYEKKEATRNYEINETKEKVVASPGAIKRLTVGVWVDASVDKAQQEGITKVVASAVGFNQARGDAISVELIPFNTDLADRIKKDELDAEKQQRQMLYMQLGVLALILLLILFIVWRRIKKKQREAEEQEMLAAMAAAQANENYELPEMEEELTEEQRQYLDQYEQIVKMAQTRPEDVAQLIKTWVTEE